MKKLAIHIIAILALITAGFNSSAQSSVEQFKKAYYDKMQKLIPSGVKTRTVKYVSVTQGSASGGILNFKVTAYIYDFNAGYPANRYWGTTCISKFENLPYTMKKNAFGEWEVSGIFTPGYDDHRCENNKAENVASLSIDDVPGTIYNPNNVSFTKTAPLKTKGASGPLYFGEYACYGTGGRLMAGMGFILSPGGKYTDVDGQRGGTYVYDGAASTISFKGGFLAGQRGTNVTLKGFQLSSTVWAEPWK